MHSVPETPTGRRALWDALVRTALLGSERAEMPALAAGDACDELLRQITHEHREDRLLQAAGIVAVSRACGAEPEPAGAGRLPQCPPETLQPCSDAAAAFLRRILADFPFLLPEALAALSAAGRRVPHELLPELLDAGRQHRDLRQAIEAVAGTRGAWLAGLNADWRYLTAAADPAEWETASAESRLSLLRSLRRSDPALALSLLAATWAQETPADRANFIAELEQGLSAADEAFLDAALGDRRKEVRRKAAELLQALPDSSLVRRMKDRVALLIMRAETTASKIRKAITGGARLEIRLPEQCDAGMERDGIERRAPKGVGDKAWWLAGMVAAVPVRFWNLHLALTAPECIEAAAKTDFGAEIVRAWAAANARDRDPEWAEALFAHGLAHLDDLVWQVNLDSIPAGRRDKFLLGMLRDDRDKTGADNRIVHLLTRRRFCWTPGLARGFLDFLRHQVHSALGGKLVLHYGWLPEPAAIATCMPPEVSAEAASNWPEEAASRTFFSPISTMIQVLDFRARMLKEINQ